MSGGDSLPQLHCRRRRGRRGKRDARSDRVRRLRRRPYRSLQRAAAAGQRNHLRRGGGPGGPQLHGAVRVPTPVPGGPLQLPVSLERVVYVCQLCFLNVNMMQT